MAPSSTSQVPKGSTTSHADTDTVHHQKGCSKTKRRVPVIFLSKIHNLTGQDATSDKGRSRDDVWNNWPAIFKSGHEGQEKSEKVFQTKEDQRGMKTKSNEWSWAGYFFKDVLVTIIKLEWDLSWTEVKCHCQWPSFDSYIIKLICENVVCRKYINLSSLMTGHLASDIFLNISEQNYFALVLQFFITV